jgi:2-succinyl-5-enolpyruvyl-6-hydroxy-3-cyclohexene-1-carboxylate synthase
MSARIETTAGDRQLARARALMNGLQSAGVTDAVVSPGSRSTPLVLAAVECGLRLFDVIDERSAAFFALGQARVSGRPSLVIATSGTAGAHHFPAVIEASASYVPLISITADRPGELQGSGALQTIDQLGLFGRHVRAFHEIAADDREGAIRALENLGAQAVLEASHPLPGAVHLNFKARKPLEPEASFDGGCGALGSGRPATLTIAPRSVPPKEAIAEIAMRIAGAARGLVIGGPGVVRSAHPEAIARARRTIFGFVRRTGFPLLAEATSQLRFADAHTLEGVGGCDRFDAILRSEQDQRTLEPELIIQLGMTPTSGGLEKLITTHRTTHRIVVAPYGWNDPDRSAAAVVAADIEETAERLAEALERIPVAPSTAESRKRWAAEWTARSARAARIIDRVEPTGALNEGEIARELVRRAPERSILMLGNGLAIRHVDTFAARGANDLVVLSQRGASGIDGLISGAAGSASRAACPTSLLFGDVALLHDVGGLFAARAIVSPLVLVAIHNDGGRIFEQLPIAIHPGVDDTIRAHFTTPHGLSFAHAARMYGVAHRAVVTLDELSAALQEAYEKPACTLIEARVEPSDATDRYERIWREIALEETT